MIGKFATTIPLFGFFSEWRLKQYNTLPFILPLLLYFCFSNLYHVLVVKSCLGYSNILLKTCVTGILGCLIWLSGIPAISSTGLVDTVNSTDSFNPSILFYPIPSLFFSSHLVYPFIPIHPFMPIQPSIPVRSSIHPSIIYHLFPSTYQPPTRSCTLTSQCQSLFNMYFPI